VSDEPLVSVVIATHNRPSLLLNAIQSVRKQSYRNIEIIVVDDCSDVDLGRIVAARHPDVRLVRNAAKRGPSHSRNEGIALAAGEIVAFLDDDDEWLPCKLEEQVLLLREADACVCGYRIRETGKARTQDIAAVTGYHLRRGNVFCGASGFAARRYVFDSVKFDEALWIGEEWDVYVQIVRDFDLRNSRNPLFIYRKGLGQSLSNQPHDDRSRLVANKIACLEKNRAFLGEFYFGVRLAGTLLRFIGARGGRGKRILATMREAGVLPTLYWFCQKAIHRDGIRFSDRKWFWRSGPSVCRPDDAKDPGARTHRDDGSEDVRADTLGKECIGR